MNTPDISIILPVYNGSALLPRAIHSIISQTFKNFELIIVDDCSTDNSLDVAQDFAAKDNRIKIIQNPCNQKLPASLNNGFAASKGAFLTWTSDDNFYYPNALERMHKELIYSGVDLIYADYDTIDVNGAVLKQTKLKKPNHLFMRNQIGACFLYKRKILDNLGGYRTDLFCAEDYEYWMRIWTKGFKLRHIPECLYAYTDNPMSLTSTKRNLVIEKTIQLKMEYVDIVPVSAMTKVKALFKLYRKSPSEELLLTMKRLSPLFFKYLLLRYRIIGKIS